MKTFLVVIAVVLFSSTAFARTPKKKSPHRSKGTVTTINLGGSAQPESPWPDVVDKGHL